MLRAMRGAAETWIIKVLMVFLVISFSIWGVGDIFRGNPQQRTVACVGGFFLPLHFMFGSTASICTGERISVQALQLDLRRAYEQEQQRRGLDYTMEKAVQGGLFERVLRESVGRKLFTYVAKDFGLRYDARAVLSQLAQDPGLQTKDGRFDTEKFKQALSKLHMSEAEFIDYMAEAYAREQSIGSFSIMSFVPQALYDELLKAHGQESLVQILSIENAKIPQPAAPDAAILEAYYKTHPDKFTATEYRAASILKIMQDEMLGSSSVTDAEVAAAFEKRQSEFAHGEQRDILQVVLANEAEAKSLAQAAQAAHDLRKAADAIKKDAVLLENQSEETIPKELYTTTFTSDVGSISDPIKTDFGYHVVQVVKITPPYKPVLAEIKDKLRDKLLREKAQEAVRDLANKVDDEVNAGKSLEDIGTTYHLPVTKITQIDLTGMDASGKKIEMLSSGLVLQNVFGLSEGESSALLDDHHGNFLLVHVDKIMPSHVQSFDEVKDKVLAAWRAQQQADAAKALAEKLMAEWQQKPQGFAELSKRQYVTGESDKVLSPIIGYDESLPKDLHDRIFGLTPGEIIIGHSDKVFHVLRLTGFRAFEPTKNISAQTSVKTIISNGWHGDIIDQFETMIRSQYQVGLDKKIIEEMRLAATNKEEP